MTDTEKLALAMEAIEAADKLVPHLINNKAAAHIIWCYVCRRRIEDQWTHRSNCDAMKYLELRKKLEELR